MIKENNIVCKCCGKQIIFTTSELCIFQNSRAIRHQGHCPDHVNIQATVLIYDENERLRDGK